MFGDLMSMAAAAGTTFLVLLFLRAVWHKLADFDRFTGFVADYSLLPAGWVYGAAKLLVGLELASIALLLVPPLNRLGALLALALLAGYGLAMGINLWRGHTRIDCGCGGPAQHLSPALLLRNALLALFAVPVLLVGIAPITPFAALAAIVGGTLLWLVYNVAEQLLANAGHIQLARQSPGNTH
ncbi:MauE/DoxX family redox-associated membrane protein [Stutzerimonas kirkiae]|nr:MauE/DoxX family redox-associated membrane protein [Stutzerimonas kirkiae]